MSGGLFDYYLKSFVFFTKMGLGNTESYYFSTRHNLHFKLCSLSLLKENHIDGLKELKF